MASIHLSGTTIPTSEQRRAIPPRLVERLRERAATLGFAELRVTRAELPAEVAGRYRTYLALGRHGSMDWLAREPERREAPTGMWPDARSAIVLAFSYAPEASPLPELEARGSGYISVYARNRDYHDLVKGRLKLLAQWLHAVAKAEVKVFVDTAPLLEKPLAQQAGMGWQGKHTNLLSRGLGNWFFLGTILTDLPLDPDAPGQEHCGACRRCLEACPTDAFPAPFQLDARRCISYLTIEHKGPIPRALRAAMGNRIYGCDDCLAVCPWNKFAQAGREMKLQARPDLVRPPLEHLARLDDAGFRAFFSGSPVKRIGRDRFLRNVLIAIGNSADRRLLPVIEERLLDPSALVRGAAVWALRRLAPEPRFMALRASHLPSEGEDEVREEWLAATEDGDGP